MSHHGWGVFYYLYTIYCSRGCFCLKTPARRGLMAYFFPARFRLLVPPSPVLHNLPLPIIHLSLPRLRLQSQPTRSSAKFFVPESYHSLSWTSTHSHSRFSRSKSFFFLCCQEDKKKTLLLPYRLFLFPVCNDQFQFFIIITAYLTSYGYFTPSFNTLYPP